MYNSKVVLIVTLFAIGCGPPPEPVSLVVTTTTVIDPSSRQVLADHSVFIDTGRIIAVSPSDARARYIAADTVDGTDKFLIPGLLDLHVHVPRDEVLEDQTLDLLLANGVTGVRDMASDCWVPVEGTRCAEGLRAIGADIDAGQRAGPRILSVASASVNGVQQRASLPEGAMPFYAPETASDGRQLAGHLAERPIDVVKVYNSVPRAAYFALVEEASRLGLEVSGHLPLGVSVLEASNAGQRTIEHARDLPVACSSYSAAYRGIMSDINDGADDVAAPSAEVRNRSILESFDQAACADVLAALVANGTYLVPTHGTREMDFRAGEQEYRDDPRMRFVDPRLLEGWNSDLDRTAEATPELVALYGDFYRLGLRLTAMAHETGVRVLVGTDAKMSLKRRAR